MLRLVGRKADGWLPSLGVLTRDELRAGNEQIDAAAEQAGRDPRSIRRIVNLQGRQPPAPTTACPLPAVPLRPREAGGYQSHDGH